MDSDDVENGGKMLDARPSKMVPQAVPQGHGKRHKAAQQAAVAEAQPRREGKGRQGVLLAKRPSPAQCSRRSEHERQRSCWLFQLGTKLE